MPTASVTPPRELTAPRQIIFTSKQIHYTQTVVLNFTGLSWPHVSKGTPVPAMSAPAIAWA